MWSTYGAKGKWVSFRKRANSPRRDYGLILSGMSDHFLQLCVIYQDLHLIELRIRVAHGDWSAVSTVYVSRSFLTETGQAIPQWI